ncbi:plasminogen activator inhibitor 1 RNA-binding protein-like [Phlebotomus papatasi]|uniref:plasminogen activator inhibitor 1 RNA-binding protein-like n=1 Tax=Phlebotomus papatasi TaxID=29031 RepID=UPI0024844E06|nr:plasminogen activator inhibitor 1 RNA-binding protein-like [Phlebotomus papatasi]
MENTYGISVDNRYELFYIDDETTDPLETVITVKKKAPKEKTAPIQAKDAAAPQPTVRKIPSAAAEKENKSAMINNQQRAAQANRTAPKATNNDKRQMRDDKPTAPKRDETVEKKNRRNREADRGPPVSNGLSDDKPRRRRFDGAPQRGKREFDRQSGSDKTGVKAVDKRDGGGAHNWGSPKQEVIDELVPKQHPAEWSEGETRADGQDGGATDEPVNQSPNQDEETKELTLDEYKALRAGKSKPPQYNLRKAGEGEDLSQWQKMVALEAKRQSGVDDGENDATAVQQRATRQKHILDIEFHFNDGRRAGQMGRGGRGGRARASGGGGGAGGAGGGGGGGGGNTPGGGRQMARNRRNDGEDRERPREPRNSESTRSHFRDDAHFHAAPKVDDEKDFPSLGLLNASSMVRQAPKLVPMYAKEDATK